jgi:dCTP deaminase
VEDVRKSGSASIDLRLGTWFVSLPRAQISHLGIGKRVAEMPRSQTEYVPFGMSYVIHPGTFVLGVTMEWIRMPKCLAGYVVGRSSWGRRGLVIATAIGVHPGFTGCLTLELANLGEIPLEIRPGVSICQLFLHRLETTDPRRVDKSQFTAQRKPIVTAVTLDPIARKLASAYARRRKK